MGTKDPRGYYSILGLPLNADAAAIKAAFRRKAMELHPDRSNSSDATKQFQLLNEAYGVLSDPASRAQYDTLSIKAEERPAATREEPPEPIVCSCCRKVTAQPRYAIFFEVKSFLIQTTRSTIQGIFCSTCAEKKAFQATAITWLFGWWGIPWGIIYSIQAIFTNMMGGKQPPDINARLAAHQAWVFAALGKLDMARAVALDALALARKIKFDSTAAKRRKAMGYDVEDEGAELRAQIEKLLESLGGSRSATIRLKDAWSLYRRPFYVQGAVVLSAIGAFWYAIQTSSPSTRSPDLKPYVANPQPAAPRKPTYVRPAAAPNGATWPTNASYVAGYPRTHTIGLSTVTVDNSQNDSDVFGKLVSLDGPNAFPVRTFFIPAHGRFTMNKVMAGNYDIRYRDLNSGHLSRSEPVSLEETVTHEGTRFSNLTMTLYKVRNGNMRTYGLAEDEF